MTFEEPSEERYDSRPEPKHEHRQDQKPHEPSGKDREQEMREPHFKHRRTQHKDFKRHGWGQHSREHQRPEFMLFEGSVNLQEALFGDALAQDFFAADIADDV